LKDAEEEEEADEAVDPVQMLNAELRLSTFLEMLEELQN
jgi:hypothetical protein